MTQFETWQAVVGVFVCLNIIQFVVGSYVEPRVSGAMLSISPFVVLFAIFFWTYLWGLFGAFIGVPIALAILTFCAQHPSSRWLADMFGDRRKPKRRALGSRFSRPRPRPRYRRAAAPAAQACPPGPAVKRVDVENRSALHSSPP